MSDELLDARGVVIEPGDTALYGFSGGGGVAMAEAVVLGAEPCKGDCDTPTRHQTVSLTPSGRVRLKVVRRSYSSGEKPIVDVAPDRLVVLKHGDYTDGWDSGSTPTLPPSPLPTQAEEARKQIEDAMASYTRGLRRTEVPYHFRDMTLAEYHVWCDGQLAQCRKKLRALDE